MINRLISTPLKSDLDEKIVILAGPRQCGKTTLSKSLFAKFDYLTYDSAEDRRVLDAKEWDRTRELVIFDELHKMRKWKSWLKGVFDKEGVHPRLLVTGSARMNQMKKAGDSLAGRHFNFHLHPFDLKELHEANVDKTVDATFDTLLNVGGFPEPFLRGTKSYYNRWRAGHIDLILRQDALDLQVVRDIKSIELLIHLLADRVGSSVSNRSLAQSLDRDPKTVARWLELLEDLYVIFRVTPYHRDIARALVKEPKFYFFDNGMVNGDSAAKFENLVACALLKELQRLQDVEGVRGRLHFLRTKEKREIDFYVHLNDHPSWMIEAKWGDESLSASFRKFEEFLPKSTHRLQLVAQAKRDRTTEHGHHIRRAAPWLAELNLI